MMSTPESARELPTEDKPSPASSKPRLGGLWVLRMPFKPPQSIQDKRKGLRCYLTLITREVKNALWSSQNENTHDIYPISKRSTP
jgi:hypothetical protein